MNVENLSWDSNFFEIRVSKIVLEKEISSIDEDIPYDLIYLISASSSVPTIKNFTSSFTQGKVLFEKEMGNVSDKPHNIYSFSDLELSSSSLYSLAYESGRYSRFNLDTKFSEKNFIQLYQAWVEASCHSNFATDVLVYRVKKEPLGFVTFSIKEKKATIGLIAVKPDFQGKGIGSALLNGVENALVKQGCNSLIIPTQLINKQACSFYEKMGYIKKEITFVTHYWRQ
jgi:ribosomal protein S18 acetylase RimI-like enzyme